MSRRRACISVGAGLATLSLAGGCGSSSKPLPSACTDRPEAIERALAGAPGRVALADGTLLSDCVARARSDADLQNLGSVLTAVADDLRARAPHDPHAALSLGYLIGAAQRGARHANGVDAELVHRLEADATLDGGAGASVLALRRGVASARRSG